MEKQIMGGGYKRTIWQVAEDGQRQDKILQKENCLKMNGDRTGQPAGSWTACAGSLLRYPVKGQAGQAGGKVLPAFPRVL